MSTEKAPETSSTSKSDGEVFQLEALSLNYLRSQNILAIPDDNQLPRLHPCKLCNKAILNFRFEAFTVLCCGHLLHRICLETHIIRGGVREPSCPTCNWGIEINREELSLALGVYRIESKDNDKGQASQQSNVTITDEDDDGGLEIMRSMGLIEEDSATAEKTKPVNTEDRGTSPIASEVQVNSTDQDNANEIAGSSSPSLKRPYQLPSGNSQSTKKVKKSNEKKDGSKNRNEVSSNVAKKLIEELSTETSQISEVVEESTGNFHDLYVAINKAEEQSGYLNQLVIKSYYNLGKALEDRYEHFKNSNPKRTAQALVNKEIRQQLPSSVSETLLRKRKERAQKIYDLFSEIGESMIQRVKSFTASSISKMSQDDTDTILVHFSQHQDTSKRQKP